MKTKTAQRVQATGQSIYWQHREPLKCPKGHVMTWLGSAFWICGKGKCNTIYVQQR